MRFFCSLCLVFWLSFAAAGEDRAWIEHSDRNTQAVFETLGAFFPEWMSHLGIERFDTQVMDLKPRVVERFDAALAAQLKRLTALRARETDARVREDLEIILEALERRRHTAALEHRLVVPFDDLPRHVFQGLQALLDQRNTEERRAHALERLRRYAGIEPGSVPIAKLSRDRTMARAQAGLLWPYRTAVEQQLNNCQRYVAGIAELFRESGVKGWEPGHERLGSQLREHCDWVRSTVLPRARSTPALPPELYADRLKHVGVDISPQQAIALGTTTFAEVREEMARLALDIARERKLPASGYRDVLRALKGEPLPRERVLPHYREVLAGIEKIIAREHLVTLPQRAASIRIATEAESAATPAPYLNIPRLIGNRGEVGEFVLPLTNPNAKTSAPVDDFTAPAAAWTLTAHEARPGHELQFASMVEGGVSLARAVFASNSTNSEGWALYAESILLPYLAPEAQLFSLQFRLWRAAREFLDPMVNLGRMTPEAAKEYLMREVTLSEPMAQQESDRYAFWSPGQAVSYLYGYSRLRELRMKAEIALGDRFSAQEFHDLVIAQGLLPARLLERAVLDELSRRYPDKSKAAESGRSSDSRSPRGAQAR